MSAGIIGFVLGMMFGGSFGFVIFAVLIAGREEDDR